MFTSITGHYSGAIDAKKRSFLPAPFRDALKEEGSSWIMICSSPSAREKELYFFLPSQWQLVQQAPLDFVRRFVANIENFDEEYFFGECFKAYPDEQGRILFRQEQLEEAGLGKQIVFIGVNDHGVIRDKALYEEQRKIMLVSKKSSLGKKK